MTEKTKYIVAFITFVSLVSFFSLDFFTSFGISFFLFFAVKFFHEIGEKIEIRDIMILLASLQWIVGPLLAYKFNSDDEFYYMAVDLPTYMGYVVPATAFFIFGLYLPVFRKTQKISLFLPKIKQFILKYKRIDLIFIGIGIVSDILSDIVPESLRFVFFLFSGLRFIGLYFLFLSQRKNKLLYVIIIMTWLFLSALKDTIFHDFLLWSSFFILIAAFITKPSLQKKLIYLLGILVIIIAIQTVKYSFREAVKEGTGSGITLFSDLVEEKVISSNYVSSESNISSMITRINQGWIIARIMSWTPSREPFAGGETISEAIKASFLPRFLFPNKIRAGGRTYFTRFTGKDISNETSMGLSLLGEAYANYGIFGGILFLFLIGFFYNFFIHKIYDLAKKHPSLVFFIPLIFLQVVKAETDFSVILNYLVKASIIVWFIFWSLNKFFKVRI